MINSKVGRKETTTDDVDAYDLIMKTKSCFWTEIRSVPPLGLSSRIQRYVRAGIIRMFSNLYTETERQRCSQAPGGWSWSTPVRQPGW